MTNKIYKTISLFHYLDCKWHFNDVLERVLYLRGSPNLWSCPQQTFFHGWCFDRRNKQQNDGWIPLKLNNPRHRYYVGWFSGISYQGKSSASLNVCHEGVWRDILTCHSRRSTDVNNKMNHGWIWLCLSWYWTCWINEPKYFTFTDTCSTTSWKES